MCLALCAACPYLVAEGALAHSTAEDSHLPVRNGLTRHTLFARCSHNLIDYSEPICRFRLISLALRLASCSFNSEMRSEDRDAFICSFLGIDLRDFN